MKSFIIFLILLLETYQIESSDIIFVVLSQADSFHAHLADDLKNDLNKQFSSFQEVTSIIHLTHIDFPHTGDWTIVPIISKILELYEDTAEWVIFCQVFTRFRLQNLLSTLGKYDSKNEVWIGHALSDKEATIIHHFAFFEEPATFLYPNIASGFAISLSLLKSLYRRNPNIYSSEVEFSIDASHEFALLLWDNGKGISLTNEPSFCIEDNQKCASYVTPFKGCDIPVSKSRIVYGVKTCKKFHTDRISVVQRTWAPYISNIFYYSEEYDKSIPTVKLDIPNTEHGHCGKTMGILNHFSEIIKKNSDILWNVIIDDDTILSSARIENLLSCFNSSDYVAIGERYGFRVHEGGGYNYITGGGGMVFSAPLVQLLTSPGVCTCPSINSPDDMYLGLCLSELGINITHSMAFHQARPPDYAADYLKNQEPVSFHKHWMIDPVKVYKEWFLDADIKGSRISSNFYNDEL